MTFSRKTPSTQALENIEGFLGSIDKGKLPYKDKFEKHAVGSDTMLKFLRPYEVEAIELSAVYKRMLIERIINLKTPDSKSKRVCENRNP